jgi:hypothetical protein
MLLEEMTNGGSRVETHPMQLEEIRREITHNIQILPTPLGEELGNFNCVMLALDLVGCLDEPCGPLGRFYVDTSFLRSLIRESNTKECDEKNGALVLWLAGEAIKHAGTVISPGRTTSKWGIGHVYEHDLLDVPTSYGDTLKFYEPVDSERAFAHLKQLFNRRKK